MHWALVSTVYRHLLYWSCSVSMFLLSRGVTRTPENICFCFNCVFNNVLGFAEREKGTNVIINCVYRISNRNISRLLQIFQIERTECHWNIKRHTSDLMMIIRQSIYILSIITTEMGELKTHNPTYCIMDNGDNIFNLTLTLDKIYLTGIL